MDGVWGGGEAGGDSVTVEPERFCPDRRVLACDFKRRLGGAPDSLPNDIWQLHVLQTYDSHRPQGRGPG